MPAGRGEVVGFKVADLVLADDAGEDLVNGGPDECFPVDCPDAVDWLGAGQLVSDAAVAGVADLRRPDRRLQRARLLGDRFLDDAEQFGRQYVGVDVAACVQPARPDRRHRELARPAQDLRGHRTITDGLFSVQQRSYRAGARIVLARCGSI